MLWRAAPEWLHPCEIKDVFRVICATVPSTLKFGGAGAFQIRSATNFDKRLLFRKHRNEVFERLQSFLLLAWKCGRAGTRVESSRRQAQEDFKKAANGQVLLNLFRQQ